MMATRAVTDRAHRYRANQLAPVAGKVCLFCGSTQFLVPDHWDGHPDHTTPDNLEHLCKSCNTAKGAAFRKSGRGRLTHQYNPSYIVLRGGKVVLRTSDHHEASKVATDLKRRYPSETIALGEKTNPTKGGGAATVGEWMQAVGAITPHIDRGDRGLVSTMSVRDAVDMIRATPQSKRRDFAAKMRRRNPCNPNATTMKHEKEIRAYVAEKIAAGKTAAEIGRAVWRRWGYFTGTSGPVLQVKMSSGTETFQANPWPFSRPDARRTTPASGGIAYHTSKRSPATAKKSPGSAAGKKGGGPVRFDVPDERILREGFKRGLSLAEILQQNPAIAILRNSNPVAFDRCVKAVQAKGGAANAYAVCTAAGTRKNPPYSIVAEDGHELGLVQSREAAFSEARSYAESGQRVEVVWKGRKGYESKWFGRKRRNPAAASVEAFKEFHGFEPSEVVTVSKKVHHHAHLAALGTLVQLDVWGVDGRGHKITGFKGALLATNETGDQLFVEGGDQSVNLADFGIRTPHETETLGRVTNIGYHTKKTHLGDEGGEAVYVHRFRATNRNGKHVVVKMTREPDLIYDVRNEQLLFSGGSYEILREGINK
jgi:hypothetical protein